MQCITLTPLWPRWYSRKLPTPAAWIEVYALCTSVNHSLQITGATMIQCGRGAVRLVGGRACAHAASKAHRGAFNHDRLGGPLEMAVTLQSVRPTARSFAAAAAQSFVGGVTGRSPQQEGAPWRTIAAVGEPSAPPC